MLGLLLKQILYRLRGWCPPTEILIKRGMKVGKDFHRLNEVILDPGHCWLIEIGDHVTLAPRVHILCHDASTKQWLGYAKIGKVTIGDNVFVGASTVILPGVAIGNNVVIGAHSTVTDAIPDNSVAAGTPAKVICTLQEYLEKMKNKMTSSHVWDEAYTVRGGITIAQKHEMQQILSSHKIGFVD